MNKRTLSIILSCFLLTNNFLDAKPLLGQTQQEQDFSDADEPAEEPDPIQEEYEETEEVNQREFAQLQRKAFITGTAVLMMAMGIAGLYIQYFNQ